MCTNMRNFKFHILEVPNIDYKINKKIQAFAFSKDNFYLCNTRLASRVLPPPIKKLVF